MKHFFLVASLLLVLPAFAGEPAPVAGKDYVEIANGSPLDPIKGVVVVEECFNYICPSCNAFEPVFAAWAKKLPPYAKLQHVPASFRADFASYARAYYAAQSFGIDDKTHQAVYDAIHKSHTLPAEGDRPDEERIAAFYGKQGVDAQQFLAAMHSFNVDFNVRRANEYMQRSKIPETPSIIINGRYRVKGATNQDMLRISTYLIEKEHAR
jgi:protein dithiol oxidoreductase (disulfide-forming)